jgi:hypothetical protein
MIHTSQNGNISTTCNQLRYLALAFGVRPQFQRLLKIQHRFWGWVAPNPLGAGVSKRRAARDWERSLEMGF